MHHCGTMFTCLEVPDEGHTKCYKQHPTYKFICGMCRNGISLWIGTHGNIMDARVVRPVTTIVQAEMSTFEGLQLGN